MLNLKKVILGLGLLGVVSSANAVCSFEYYNQSNEKKSVIINENTFGSVNARNPIYGSLDTISFVTDKYCNIVFSTTGGKVLISPNNSSFLVHGGPTIPFLNTSTPKSTSGTTGTPTEDRLRALEDKVYSCVQ